MPEEYMPNTISVIQGTRDFKDAQILLQEKGIPITMTLKQQVQKWDDKQEEAARNRRILARCKQKFQIARRKHLIATGQDIPNPWKDVEPEKHYYHPILFSTYETDNNSRSETTTPKVERNSLQQATTTTPQVERNSLQQA